MNDPVNYDLPPGDWVCAHRASVMLNIVPTTLYQLVRCGRHAILWHDARPLRRIGIRQHPVRFFDVTDIRNLAMRETA